MVFLEGAHIHLRAMEPTDLENLYLWENDPENWFVSQTRTPYSKHALKQFIEDSQKDIYEIKQLRFMIILNAEDNDENTPVGAIDLFDFDPYHRRAGIGILVARKEYRRKGIASEALSLLIHYSFNLLGLHQLYCNVAKGNDASFKLFIKSGFKVTGEKKDWLRGTGSWTDEYLLQLINPRD
jgi:diamine N-acetyltransferase